MNRVARALLWVPAVVQALGGCGTVLRPPEPRRSLVVKVTGAEFRSSNGFRFVALPSPGARVVHLRVRYPVGSVDDPVGKEGLAHLVEHLLFYVERPGAGGATTSIQAELSRIAIGWNASTDADHTDYQTVLPADALEAAIGLEVDRLDIGCAGITPRAFALAKEIVQNELRTRLGDDGAEVMRAVKGALFPEGNPYRREDSVESVAGLTLADACDFLAGPYRRGGAFVIAAGAVTPEELQRAARQIGRMPARVPAAAVGAPPQVRPGRTRITAPIERPALLVAWPLPPASSRDHRLLRRGWGNLAARVSGFAHTYRWGRGADLTVLGGARSPALVMVVDLDSPDDLDEAIDAVRKAIPYTFRMIAAPGEDRRDRGWRREVEASALGLVGRWEALETRTELMADLMEDEGGGSMVKRLDELERAGPQALRALAERTLTFDRARLVVLEPDQRRSTSATRIATYRPDDHGSSGAPVDPSLADRPLEVPPGGLRLDVVRYRMENGLTVVLWPHGEVPLVHARLLVRSGSAQDPPGEEGTAQLVASTDVLPDDTVFTRRTLATQVDELISGMSWRLRSPGAGLGDRARELLGEDLGRGAVAGLQRYQRAYLTALYGADHPYARPDISTASLGRIDRDSLTTWMRDHFVPRNSCLILTGRFEPALVRRWIDYNLDQVDGGDRDRHPPVWPRPRRSWIAGTSATRSPTVNLQVGFVGPAGLDEHHAERLVLEALLDERVEALRERRALTYGVSAHFWPRQRGGLWQIGGEVNAARAGEAAAALVAAIDEVRRDPEAYRADFVRARQRVLDRLLSSATDSAAVADRLVLLARFDLPDYFFDLVAARVSRLVLRDLHRFVARELRPEGQVVGAYGEPAPVAAALRAAGAPDAAAR